MKKLRTGLGLWRYYQIPKNIILGFRRNGIRNELQSYVWRARMEKAAQHLSINDLERNGPAAELHFLTGKKFWYQTSFCAYSFVKNAKTHTRPVIYDDGTLQALHRNKFLSVFPDAKIVSIKEINERLDHFLPETKFPSLRHHRVHYTHLRKLTDIRAGSSDWQLVLDSDMLFFKKPLVLMQWLKSPQQPCYMTDVRSAYGYSDQLMLALAKSPLPERVNVGICGLNSAEIDWEEVEFWCKSLVEKEGLSFYLEQALTTLLYSRKNCLATPPEQYLVFPDCQEVKHPQAVMHHYTGESKIFYFQYGWRHLMRKAQ